MARIELKPIVFERTVSSLSTKELINIVSDGDAPVELKKAAGLKLDKLRVNLSNVKSYV